MLEEKLHNPKAKVVYDVFGAKPGAMLYSQFTWLMNNITDGDGEPTKPQLELHGELTQRLTVLIADFSKLTGEDLTKLNESATSASLPTLFTPPAKLKRDEPKAAAK